jgi:hypothetical protein
MLYGFKPFLHSSLSKQSLAKGLAQQVLRVDDERIRVRFV